MTAHGVDALQALVMALVGVRKRLDASDLAWLGETGDVGLPLVVPESDPAFLSIIEALIEAEYARRLFTLQRARTPSTRRTRSTK